MAAEALDTSSSSLGTGGTGGKTTQTANYTLEYDEVTDPLTGEKVTIRSIVGPDGSRRPDLSDPVTAKAFEDQRKYLLDPDNIGIHSTDQAKDAARQLKELSEKANVVGTPGLKQDVANDKIFGGPQSGQSVFTDSPVGKLLGGVASIYGLGGVLGGSGSGSGTGTGGVGGAAGGINTDAISAAAAASRAMSDKFLAEYNASHPNQPPTMTAAQLPPAAQAEMIGQIQAAQAAGLGPIQASQAAGLDPIKAAQAAQLDPFSASHARATLLDPTQQAEQRARALDLEGQYGDVIAGKTPSVAELQLREAEQRQEANQLGLASKASGGGNVALALRTAANNIGRLNQGSSADAALLRAKEIEAARAGLGGLITNTRAGDITFAGHDADLATDVSKTNAGLDTSATLKAAELEAARRASNAGLTTTAAVKDADLEAARRAFNAGQISAAALKDAELEAARRAQNAQLTTSTAIQDAQLEAARRAANAGQINQTSIAQGQLTNTASANNLTASLEQQRIDQAARDAAAKNAIASSGQVITGTVGAAQAQAEAVKAAQAAKAAEDAKQAAGLGALGALGAKLLARDSGGSGTTYGANGSPIID